MVYIPPGCSWGSGYIKSFNNRLRKECLNRNHWTTLFEARVVIGDFKHVHNHRHRHSALLTHHRRDARQIMTWR
jgi:transposase InsO family protein